MSFLFYERTARLVQEFDNNYASYTVEVYIAADLVLFPSFVSHSIWSLPTCNSTPTCAINYIYILSLPQGENGDFSFRINANNFRDIVRYRFNPFCVKSRVRITAEVEEAGRGTKQSDTVSFPLVANPVRVRLADDNPQLFRAGLNYTLKV